MLFICHEEEWRFEKALRNIELHNTFNVLPFPRISIWISPSPAVDFPLHPAWSCLHRIEVRRELWHRGKDRKVPLVMEGTYYPARVHATTQRREVQGNWAYVKFPLRGNTWNPRRSFYPLSYIPWDLIVYCDCTTQVCVLVLEISFANISVYNRRILLRFGIPKYLEKIYFSISLIRDALQLEKDMRNWRILKRNFMFYK